MIGIIMSVYNEVIEAIPMTRSHKKLTEDRWQECCDGIKYLRKRIDLKDLHQQRPTRLEKKAYKEFVSHLDVEKNINYRLRTGLIRAVIGMI